MECGKWALWENAERPGQVNFCGYSKTQKRIIWGIWLLFDDNALQNAHKSMGTHYEIRQ